MSGTSTHPSEHVDTVIIGGGQAGLVAGYELKKRRRDFVILDAHPRVGDAWRDRWDSLRLFTPRRDSALAGLRMPGVQSQMPTKDEMADYLEAYVAHHSLPVRNGMRVTRLSKSGDLFRVETSAGQLTASNVVVSSGSYGNPKTPAFAVGLDTHLVQLHSSQYHNPSQLQPGGVLLVGAGNSGNDIAMDVSTTHDTWLAGPKLRNVPVEIDKWLGRTVIVRVVRFAQRNILCLSTPIGRKKAAKLRVEATPVIRVKPKWLDRQGVHRIGRVVAVKDGLPVLDDGQTLDVTNVIWCTGFNHDFPWIDLPGFDQHGIPAHDRGVSTQVDGLYFLGLPFQYALASASLWGIGRDASHVAGQLAKRARAMTPVAA